MSKFHLTEIICKSLQRSSTFSLASLKPLSFKKSCVEMRTAATDHVSAAFVGHVERSGRSHFDALICNWKGLKWLFSLCSLEKLNFLNLTVVIQNRDFLNLVNGQKMPPKVDRFSKFAAITFLSYLVQMRIYIFVDLQWEIPYYLFFALSSISTYVSLNSTNAFYKNATCDPR